MKWNRIKRLFLVLSGAVIITSCEKAPITITKSDTKSEVKAAGSNKEILRYIRISFEGGEVIAGLNDNLNTESLLAQLPVYVTFSDFQGAEKTAYLPDDLLSEDIISPYDPQKGEVACYGPWGNLVLYYDDQPKADGIIPMGRVFAGLEKLEAMKGDFTARIEEIEMETEQICRAGK